MKQISCGVCRDLLPLVEDGVACEESCRLVEEHLAACPACRALSGPPGAGPAAAPDDGRVLASLRRGMLLFGLALLLLGTVLGVALSNGMGMFYNILLMPLVGAGALFILPRRWPWAVLSLFLLTCLWVPLAELFSHGWPRESFAFYPGFWSSGLFFAFIYSLLALLGAAIAALLRFAFRKEAPHEHENENPPRP